MAGYSDYKATPMVMQRDKRVVIAESPLVDGNLRGDKYQPKRPSWVRFERETRSALQSSPPFLTWWRNRVG